jgi:3-hydroxy-3-methylglutaryl CoA synthase
MVVIDGHGGYVPLYRIDREAVAAQHDGRASGESAVPARDENHVTMASEAAENALARADVAGADLDAVFAASITDPFAEHGIAAHVAYRLGATGDVRTGDFRGTPRAATDALVTATEYVEATGGDALVVAADVMPAEPGHDEEATAGAGAGALVVRADAEDPAATVSGTGQETTGFVERHREHGESAIAGDGKFEGQQGFGTAVEPASERALADADGLPAYAAVGVHDPRMASGALREFPDTEHVSTFDRVGYAGAATLLLDTAHLLESADAGETALLVGYGAGGADAVALATEDGVGGDGARTVETYLDASEEVTYAKHLEYREPVDYEGVKTP